MLPAPRTIAISTPRSWTTLICCATACRRSGSVPKSSEPRRDSPESFRRTRRKTGCDTRRESLPSVAHDKAGEAADDDVLARLCREVRAELLDRLPVVLLAVDVLLVEQDPVLHPLLDLPLLDPAADVLGLALGLGLLLVHAHLGVFGLLRDLVLGDVLDAGHARDVQRDVLRERDEVLVARHEVRVAVDLDEHADLAVGVDVGLDRALARLAAGELADLAAHLHAQDLDGLLHVAAGLLEGTLAVHHAGARLLTQRLDVRGGDRGGAHASVSSWGAGCGDAGSGVWSDAGGAGWWTSGWTVSVSNAGVVGAVSSSSSARSASCSAPWESRCFSRSAWAAMRSRVGSRPSWPSVS